MVLTGSALAFPVTLAPREGLTDTDTGKTGGQKSRSPGAAETVRPPRIVSQLSCWFPGVWGFFEHREGDLLPASQHLQSLGPELGPEGEVQTGQFSSKRKCTFFL